MKSRLSFKPLIEAWEKNAREGRSGTRKLYQILLDRIQHYPELLEPIEDLSILKKHSDWVDLLVTTLFPVSYSDRKDLYAVGIPFTHTIIYSSNRFRDQFLDEQGNFMYAPQLNNNAKLLDEKCSTALKLILSRLYGHEITGNVTTIQSFQNPKTGLVNYVELELDPSFIDVVPLGPLPNLQSEMKCCSVEDLTKMNNLQELLPLDQFLFEGIIIVRLKDVTERESINNIKSILLEQLTFADNDIFFQLEKQMQTLVGIHDLRLGISPYFRVNGHYVFSDSFAANSIMMNPSGYGMETFFKVFQEMFRDNDRPVLFEDINAKLISKYPYLGRLTSQGYYSVAFFPLKSNGQLIGVLSTAHGKPGSLQYKHLGMIKPAIPLFVLALEQAAKTLDTEIDRVIKKHFTAVQSSVEWKFTETALQYLVNKKHGIKSKIEPIFFEQVFPLYGAIDIRNSTVERNNAIQLDLMEQLKEAAAIVEVAKAETNMPILQEVAYRIDKYLYNVSNLLFSGDEAMIDNFLKNELVELLEHLRVVVPSLASRVDTYFSNIDPKVKLRDDHRRDFEESIALVNQELSRFLDIEQEQAQRIYPHYFERFVTDGVDFNMYIGQSIAPERPFDTFYLKNLKMWQLTVLARAAQMVEQMQSRLSSPLQTTQLILAHSLPISISFRTAERKFDVDGAYNIRYEIIKKRIDKVRLRNSNERLTQPGKLAIVFSQSKETAEYLDYIEFLQNQGLLLHDLEQLELEELQGVVGLKALRVGINMNLLEKESQPENTLKLKTKGEER